MSNIEIARRRIGLTQVQLARRAGISQSLVSLVENGYRPKRSTVIEALAEALDTQVSDLNA